jgi:hypothetical protein
MQVVDGAVEFKLFIEFIIGLNDSS